MHCANPLRLALVCAVLGAAALVAPPLVADDPVLRLGAELTADEALAFAEAEPDGRGSRIGLRAAWQDVEREPGQYDWSATEAAVEALAAAGYRVVLTLTGSHDRYLADGELPAPERGESLGAWLRFCRSAVRRHRSGIDTYQVGQRIEALDPDEYGFLLKQTALALRAQAGAEGAEVAVAQAAVSVDALEAQQALWDDDVAAYIDVLPVIVPTALPLAEARVLLFAFLRENVLHPPAARIWARIASPRADEDGRLAGRAIMALAAGAGEALLGPGRDPGGRPERLRWLAGAQRALGEGHQPAPLGELSIIDPQGRPVAGAEVLGRFFSDRDFSTLLFYEVPPEVDEESEDLLRTDARGVRNVRRVDPATGEVRRVGGTSFDGRPAIRVTGAANPQLVTFQEAAVSPGFELPPEEVATTRSRDLTAEEIIARYQTVQQLQDDRVDRVFARGRVDFHFRLSGGANSFDVSIESNYFWERGRDLEWEQTDYFFNGNKVRWKKIPQLPLVQPEKVITLPLDLSLDKTYSYRLIRRDKVGDREAYVLEFQPFDPDAELSLYRGRVWIDTERFIRLKAEVVQTNLDSPVLSNEEIDIYAPQIGPDGREYWLLTRIEGQQTWNAAGRTFVVQRELVFREFEINPDPVDFDARRERAYESDNQVLADTKEGFRYLEKQPDGSRVLKAKTQTHQWLVGGGAFADGSRDITPLAGANYFDYDFLDKDIQLNAFWAGPLGFLTISKPDLGGTRMDLTGDLFLSAIKFSDRLYLGADELVAEAVDVQPQRLSLRFGIPIGNFWKVNLIGGLGYQSYSEHEDSQAAIAVFNANSKEHELVYDLPVDHAEVSATVQAEFNRRGYTVRAEVFAARRSDWQTFGLRDLETGSYGSIDPQTNLFVPHDPAPADETFRGFTLTGLKEWYLPSFQKARAEVNYLAGEDLDRFSQYGFSLFGDGQLRGFAGTGIRFDQGLIARAGYSFNLLEAIRFDFDVERARVRDRSTEVGWQEFTGAGIAGNLVGPWKTVINLSYGYALQSDIPDLEGSQEFLILVLKLF